METKKGGVERRVKQRTTTMTIMAKKRKKKGRPSLLDLQKRSLKQQLQLQKQNQNSNSLNFASNPTKRPYAASLPPAELFTAGDDDDDERKEKKHKLLLGFNSNSNGLHFPTLSPFDKNADGGDDPDDVDRKRRKIGIAAVAHHGSYQMSQKALKATDNSCSVHGLQVETGPTTPLPDKKLLVFILDRLQKKDTYGVFSEPVDPEELPDYHEIIENPMDFGTVRKKLDSGAYTNLEQFEKDIFLICSNAMEYNSSDTIYFRQARSMHELAKKDFENLRQDSDNDDEEPQPKIVRRGRPPGKKVTKPIESSPVDCVRHESFSDPTLASGGENANGSNTYNLRKVQNANMFQPADAVNGVFHGSLCAETSTSWLSEWENEFPPSVLRSLLKYGKKQFPVDENKRDTYRFSLAFPDELSTLAVLDREQKQLVEVGDAYLEHSYARSVARFATDLGPVVWKIALKKIESILPIQLKCGPGCLGENEVSNNVKSIVCEEVIPNPAAYDLTISRLLPQSISGSNSFGSDKFFMQGREDMETLARLTTHNELASLNSNVIGTRTMTIAPFQFRQNSAVQPWINGPNSCPNSYILPQMGISLPTTLMDRSSQAEASVPPQIFGVASTSNTAIVPVRINDIDSSEPKLLMNASNSDYGIFLPQGSSGFGSFRASATGFVGEASLQGWAMPQNQDSHHPFTSDLNERFRAPGSPTSLVQPDLALQLRMGR